uniref:Uncharacterized protein n=1 Tax=Glossina austeni TaxID=7395 RepID=A0A1A9UT58_GLOAU
MTSFRHVIKLLLTERFQMGLATCLQQILDREHTISLIFTTNICDLKDRRKNAPRVSIASLQNVVTSDVCFISRQKRKKYLTNQWHVGVNISLCVSAVVFASIMLTAASISLIIYDNFYMDDRPSHQRKQAFAAIQRMHGIRVEKLM